MPIDATADDSFAPAPPTPPSKLVTIERHILEQQRAHPSATGAFTRLLQDIALAAKLISREITRAGLVDVLGTTDTINPFGERQQKLDVFADAVIWRINDHTGRLCAMLSEETSGLRPIPPHHPTGQYVLIYDPLDGSSNIDVNVSVGTVFAIHRRVTPPGTMPTLADALQPGHKLVAAGYVVYGSSTMMVYSTGQGVHGFTLDPTLGEFVLSHPNMRFPQQPHYYSINHGYAHTWSEGVRHTVAWLTGQDASAPRAPFSLRYIGSLVADFHRNLLKGGLFLYPGTVGRPQGKLRLLHEVQALAFIARQAGGRASDGLDDILGLTPRHTEQCVPLFVGNTPLVNRAEALIQAHDADWRDAYLRYRDG